LTITVTASATPGADVTLVLPAPGPVSFGFEVSVAGDDVISAVTASMLALLGRAVRCRALGTTVVVAAL
jgi:hypothetical protein